MPIDPQIDYDNLEISFPCASTYPYRRYDWWKDEFYNEVLKISDEAIDMTRLNGGASVLKNHDTNIVLGKIVRAWVSDNTLCVRIRFRTDDMSRALFTDLASGTVPNVSIGYHYDPEKDVRQYVNEKGENVREVIHWTAYEVSVAVGVPADPTVGMLRSLEMNSTTIANNATKNKEGNPMRSEENTRAEEDTEALKSRLAELEAENKKLREDMEDKEPETEDAEPETEEKACGGEDNKEERSLMKNLAKDIAANIRSYGMPAIRTQRRQYNVADALKSCITGKGAEMEREISDNLYRNIGQSSPEHSIMIPFNGDTLRGVLNTRELKDAASSGSGLVAQENLPDLFIDYVRTKIGVKNATFLTGLTGAPVTLPAQTTDTSVVWVNGGTVTTDANTAVSETTPVISNIELTPHKLGGFTTVGRDMILMANPDATGIVMRSLLANIAHKLGTTMLKGNASNPSITGVATASGVQTYTIATIASATWANMTGMIGMVDGLEFDGEQEWIMSAADKATFKSIAKGSYGSGFLCEDDRIDGRLVHVDGSLSTGEIFFGDFSNIVVGQWGGIEIGIDPYTLMTAGNVRVVVSLVCDIGIRRPNTFVKRVAV